MKLEIYMKSGNCILIDNVIEYEIKNAGDEITSIRIEQKKGFFTMRKLLVKTISLSQIEAVILIN